LKVNMQELGDHQTPLDVISLSGFPPQAGAPTSGRYIVAGRRPLRGVYKSR
jgi:hypothetical protein